MRMPMACPPMRFSAAALIARPVSENRNQAHRPATSTSEAAAACVRTASKRRMPSW